MPPKHVPAPDQGQPRVLPYDLRRKNIPYADPPAAPGEKQARTYVPRKTSAAVAAIRNEARKQAISKTPRQNVVVKKAPVMTRQQTARTVLNTARRSATPSNRLSRSRSRSVSRAASIPAAKRVRFSQVPPMASGALQPAPEPSSEANEEEDDTDDEADDDENHEDEDEDEDEELPAQATAQIPVQSRNIPVQNIGNIASSDFEAMEAHADAAAASFYVAREAYKAAQHKVQVAQARRQYMELRHDRPMTSDAEEALEEAMISADFPLEASLQLYVNKKVVARKVLSKVTCKSFNITDFQAAIDQHFYNACGLFEYNFTKCTATFKHSSNRGGTRAHDIDHLTEEEVEELLDLIEAARNRHHTGHMIVSFAVYVEYDPKAVPRAAVDTDISSPMPSSPPQAPAVAKKGRRNRTSYLQEQHEARVQVIRNVGDFQRQLMERWRCIDDNCTNRNNFCFPDPSDRSRHYNITAPQTESWASAISSSEATIHSPPIKIWQYWQSQGTITRESREPIRKSAAAARQANFDRLIELQTQNIEMTMQQQILDRVQSQQEQEERRKEIKERRQLQQDIQEQAFPPLYYNQPPASAPELFFRSPLYRGITTPRAQYNPQPAPTPTPAAPIFNNRTSSPIDTVEEDADILALFFEWKLDTTRNADQQDK
ncbi:hypothetical protein BJX63DRAFT_394123 [Aspergillus granulosus]|uniref:Uncharacterized protein n=1 Tax=Aspergillus granulosus TaxID=176169 RepID=A0ABR4HDJ4_9EURO